MSNILIFWYYKYSPIWINQDRKNGILALHGVWYDKIKWKINYPSPFPVLQYSLNCVHSTFTFLAPMLHPLWQKYSDKENRIFFMIPTWYFVLFLLTLFSSQFYVPCATPLELMHIVIQLIEIKRVPLPAYGQ